MKHYSYLLMLLLLLSTSTAVAQFSDFDPATLSHRGLSQEINTTDNNHSSMILGSEPLFGGDSFSEFLLLIDPDNAMAEVVGTMDTPVPAGFAYDAETNLLYLTDSSNGVLSVVIPTTSETTAVGNTGLYLMHSAAIDPTTGILYVTGSQPYENSHLYSVDKATAVATHIGDMGIGWVSGMDFDPISGVLYASLGGPEPQGAIMTVDKTTGQATVVAPSLRYTGLTFTSSGQLIGIENWSDNLYEIDPSDGSYNLIGTVGHENVLALVFGSNWSVTVESIHWGDLKASYR